VAHGLRHCRTLHRNEGHRLRRRLSRGLHPPHGRPTFDNVPQLYIDPVECIDCGACVPVCPVSAIFALDDLPEKWKQYTELNESYVKAGKFTPEEFAKHQGK
jgi:NAD-dependent dihydropyrimidine dehydrogenase PreA subunit